MRAAVLLASLLAVGCTFVPADTSEHGFPAEALAIDGDTLSIDLRLLGADALERKQMCERNGRCEPCGKQAQDTAARLVRDKNAVIMLTGDATYGRPVATVTVEGRDLGEGDDGSRHGHPGLPLSRAGCRASRRLSALVRSGGPKAGGNSHRALGCARRLAPRRASCLREERKT
jgi:micrococcal nuclease